MRSLRLEWLEPRHLLSVRVWLDYLPTFATDLLAAVPEDLGGEGDPYPFLFDVTQGAGQADIALLKQQIVADLETIFEPVPGGVVFNTDAQEPQGDHETVDFGGTDPYHQLYGQADSIYFDWGNLTPNELAHVFVGEFAPFITAAAGDGTPARQVVVQGVAAAIANVAAHEIGHLFGLDHYTCFGDPAFDPTDTDGDQDDYGDDTYRFANISARHDFATRPITLALAA